ncbi:hypothetical protein NQ317_001310 [Molorchus minor]|uniref:Transposase n=1 Tax=Molorchus minor TaxID=1323400 RepID=A0ABQ9ITZ1_9CUCU|nr:hypothetical protein NQ317_001310 [Molorchus minor]
MCGDEFLDFVENILLEIRINMHFQQDGAPPHNSRAVSDYLNQIFPNKWIGTHGPIRWTPRSPDSTPMDYFLWGYLKDKVYQTSLTDLEELKNRIGNECEALNVQLLRSVTIRELLHRAQYCLE